MNGNEIRQQIAVALSALAQKPLPAAASEFFTALGYRSARRLEFPSLTACLAEFDREGKAAKYFPEATTKRTDAVLVQQLTSEEIAAGSGGQLSLLNAAKLDPRQFESYLFFAVPLPDATYTRTELAERARARNSLFPQPVLALFRHGANISLAITYRRTSKRDQSRDVIERKVTLIKDIACAQSHPGHLAILEDFSLAALSKARQRDIRNFADLDDAWRESLSTQLLNQQFYDEIANWYFWARELWKTGEVKLPAHIKTEADASLFLIRLLTRLIFCWFLREKINPQTGQGLIPDELFEPRRLPELIRDVAPDGSAYYTAILQNLFFATLNTEMDAPGEKPIRRFLDAGDGQRSDDHMVHQLWRHEDKLKDRAAFETLFRRIPFLNGGLFECLDDRVQKGRSSFTTEIRLDGFSSDPKKQPKLPNRLFYGRTFDETYPVNLSEAYGDSTRSKVNVRPLLEIFRRFKFTLTENTPIEEEVALDPELLGHVFENLLAAYNPETGTVARKTTGSFYTPRVAVDWRVDEALVVYLHQRVPEVSEEKLRDLLSWNPIPVELTPAQRNALIHAIDSLKALDPACGSGAFPMGLLQKLVHLLKQIDPDNKGWERLQITAAKAQPSASAREAALAAIKLAFTRDNDDYGRKLYLIENCLYGVDTAVAYPCIFVAQKIRHIHKGDLPNPDEFKLADRVKQLLAEPDRTFRVMTWTPGPPLREFPLVFEDESFPLAQRELRPGGWQLERPAELRLLERIRAAGKPLREFVGARVSRGLTTGLNEAFVVDRATRDRLVREHKSSAEILKPYMRGKDINRWYAEFADQFIVKIESSENKDHPWSGKSKKEAEEIFAKSYPAIHAHFENLRSELIKRDDQGKYFWEQRSCKYWQEFGKPKIVSTKISIRPTFALDSEGRYLGNTAYFFPAATAGHFLLGLLNSSLFFTYAKKVFVEKQGGWFEVQPDGLESFPIPAASPSELPTHEFLTQTNTDGPNL